MTTPYAPFFIALSNAYDVLNVELFSAVLPGAVFVLDTNPRSSAFFKPQSIPANGKNEDAIGINGPLASRLPPVDALSLLCRQMVTQWQYHFGSPSRAGYFNSEWIAEMNRIGLAVHREEGRRLGFSAVHSVVPGSPFQRVAAKLIDDGFAASLLSPVATPLKSVHGRSGSRIRYRCADCGVNVWGKAGLSIVCGLCHQAMSSHVGK